MTINKRFILRGVLAVLLVSTALLSGLMMANADGDSWSDSNHAVTDWYDPIYATYTIDSADKLAGVAKLVNDGMVDGFEGKILQIDTNLDLSDYLWVPIGNEVNPFKGTFITKDGVDYSISGIRLQGNWKYAGLFGYVENGTIGGFNITSDNNALFSVSASGDNIYAGSVVGYMSGNSTVFDVTNTLAVTVNAGEQMAYAGGIVGHSEGKVEEETLEPLYGKLSNVSNSASVTVEGNAAAGGTIGSIGGELGVNIMTPNNSGAVTVHGQDSLEVIAGGIVGYAQASVTMSEDDTITLNSGAVSVFDGSYSYAGGIIGKSDSAANFSIYTFNEGAVFIQSGAGNGSYVGGLIGASQGTVNAAVSFINSGMITNNGNSEVYTGGMIGYMESAWSLEQAFTNTVSITATGSANVFTGGVIGKAFNDVAFYDHVVNEAGITVAENGALTEAYTGGLIGYAETQVWLENEETAAYANSGAIQVTGDEFLYTGGIIANRAYSRTGGLPDNVISTGNITVFGDAYLYTGGFIGKLERDSIEQSVSGAAYGAEIMVQGAVDAENLVATGGIIGFYESSSSDALLSNLSFSGQLQASAGDVTTYTGGIVGYAEEAMITNVQSGADAAQHALIVSDGVLGGIAGYVNGSIEQAEVQYLTLTAGSVGAIAGGVAGQAAGSITGAAVGDSEADGSSSVIFNTNIADGVDQLTAGGIVGANTSALSITNSEVERITLLNEESYTQYVFGGIAGALNEQASLGEEGLPLYVKHMTIALLGDDSQIGGAIGFNEAPELYINTEHITIAATGHHAVIGGVIGKNAGVLGHDTTDLYSVYPVLTASGELPKAGGIAGENIGTLVEAVTEKTELTATSVDSQIGGIAGYNASKLVNVKAVNASIKANADRVLAGGIAGYSAPNGDTTDDGVSIVNAEVEKTEALPLLTTTGMDSKIGGIVGFASNTDITNPAVSAAAPNSVIILGQAAQVMAGGIAGSIEGGTVSGDIDTITANADNMTIRNIAFRFNPQAENSYIGGIAGYAEATAFDAMSVHTQIITLEGARGTIGGAVGYYHGDSANGAIFSNMILNTVTLRGMETAEQSIIGGMIGVNAQQAADPETALESAASTIKNARIIGNLANPNSPIIDSRAANSIVGGIVGENSSFVANVSLIDLNAITSSGADSIVGGHTAINRSTGVIYNTYANAKLTVTGGNTTVGGLVGSNEGTIIGSYVDTPVSSGSAGTAEMLAPLGGLVGINKSVIKKSYVQSNVTASGAHAIVGGLVGLQQSGSIDNSYAGGNVTASGSNAFAGGFAGKIAAGSIQYSYAAMNVKAASSAHGGGFAGRYDTANKELLYKNYYIKDEKVNLNKDLPDFAEGNYRWLNIPARLSTVLDETLKDRAQFPGLSGWDFTNIWRYGSVNSKYLYPELVRAANGGGGNEHNVNANVAWYTHDPNAVIFEIRTEAELSGLAAIVNGTVPGVEQFGFNKRIIRLMNPIHIQSNEWIPIGKYEDYPFEGTFDGNGDADQGEGYLIDGYRMSNGTDATGLFGYVDSKATIENVNIEPLSLAGAQYVGALAAVNAGKISNVKLHLEDEVSLSGQIVGGLIGKNSGNVTGITLTSTSEASINAVVAEGAVGSLVGSNESDINASNEINNAFSGLVSSTSNDTAAGGWIGRQAGSIEGLTVQTDYELQALGEGNIAGGFIGHYVEGALENLTLELGGKKLAATSTTSILGGVIGRSEAEHTVNDAVITSIPAGEIQGNGIIGGVIGSKTGSAGQGWDVTEVSFTDAIVGSQSDSTANTLIGGIIGLLEDAAVQQLSFNGQLIPLSLESTVGGIIGVSNDSVLYEVQGESTISYEAKQGTSKLGGIVGLLHADHVDDRYSLGHAIPLYLGIYKANAHNSSIEAWTEQSGVNVTIGGIVGINDHASIYFSDAEGQLTAAGFQSAKLGGLAGETSGNIVQSAASPSINADNNTLVWAGGLVGIAHDGEIHYSEATAPAGQKITVTNMKTAYPVLPEGYIGGFIGVANEVQMSRVFSTINVNVESQNQEDSIYAGGFAGALGNEYELDRAQIEWAHAQGDVSITGKSVSFGGGFSGTINHYDVINSYAKGNVKAVGHDMRSGGFAAAVDRHAMIKDSLALQDKLQVTGVAGTTRAYVGGFAAYSEGKLDHVYAHATDMNSVAGANTYKGGLVGYLFSDGSITDSVYLFGGEAVGYRLGSISNIERDNRTAFINQADWDLLTDATILLDSLDELVVSSPLQLNTSVLLTNDSTGLNYLKLFKRDASVKLDVNTKLGADLDLSNWSWKPYDSFKLVFDGQGHTITGLKLVDYNADQVGFIKENSGIVQNVRFVDASAAAGDQGNAAIVAGSNLSAGHIINVEVIGTVGGGSAAGVIAGLNEGRIAEINAEAFVVSTSYAGGLVGRNLGDVTEVTVDSIAADAQYTGGIAGLNEGRIEDAVITAEIKAGQYSGGAAGSNDGYIEGVKAAVTVAGKQYSGGIAGSNNDTIIDSVVAGSISGGEFVGGIAGINEGGITESSLNKGIVTGEKQAGGIAATNNGSITGIIIAASEVLGKEATGGIAAINEGDIVDVSIDATVRGKALVGGIAATNSGNIEGTEVQGLVAGDEQIGGVAGNNSGMITEASVSGMVTGGQQVGGVAAINSGNIEAAVVQGTVTGSKEVGGITALNEGTVAAVEVQELYLKADTAAGGISAMNKGNIIEASINATIIGKDQAGGAAAVNNGNIKNITVLGTVTGNKQVGGVAGVNEGAIEQAAVDATISSGELAGGIAGKNSAAATIVDSSAIGMVSGTGEAGGLAGINEGGISKSYAGNSVTGLIAGGITGSHAAGAVMNDVFAYGSVDAQAETATAGGIAGKSSGTISNSYAAGVITASGTKLAYAGGIAGYAEAGQMTNVMNYGEAAADVNGKIEKGKSFTGGIAGQKLDAAAIQNAVFNHAYLQVDSAYYDERGVRVSGAVTGFGYNTAALISEQLPFAFASSNWQATKGFYPQLKVFAGTDASKVSTAAIHLLNNESAYSVIADLKASHTAGLVWSSSKAQFTMDGNVTGGRITGEGVVELTATAGQLSKQLRLNVQALEYAGKAAAPYFVTEHVPFKESVLVELASDEAGAVIYYTLDDTEPTAESLRYTDPIELTATTTIRAIAVADDVYPSEELTGLWRKQPGSSGGIFIPIIEKEYIPVRLGNQELPVHNGSRATVARNSKLSLVVPDDVIVYYTTDGSVPTKDSPIYTGELLITNNMQLKYITSKEDDVVTLNYTVAPAQFSIKTNAAALTYMSGYRDNTFAPNQPITRQELIVGLYELLDIEDVPLGTLLKDITEEQAELVAKFESAGLVEGYSDGTFRGSNGLTRAEFVTIVTRILKLNTAGSSNLKFTDVQGHWASKAINAVAAAGHIKGYPNGSFKPDQKITRAEAVVLINRIFGIKAKASTKQDFADVPPKHWAYEEIMNAAK